MYSSVEGHVILCERSSAFYIINGIAILLALFDRIRIVRGRRIERLVEQRRQN